MIFAHFEHTGVTLSGHADTAQPGELDMVCAAVSGVVATYTNGLILYTQDYHHASDANNTSITFKYFDELIARYTAATLFGLLLIAEQYPEALSVTYETFTYGRLLDEIKDRLQ